MFEAYETEYNNLERYAIHYVRMHQINEDPILKRKIQDTVEILKQTWPDQENDWERLSIELIYNIEDRWSLYPNWNKQKTIKDIEKIEEALRVLEQVNLPPLIHQMMRTDLLYRFNQDRSEGERWTAPLR